MDIVFEPPFAMQHVLGIGLLAALLAVFAYLARTRGVSRVRRGVLCGLRIVSLAGLTLLLLRPMRRQPAPETKGEPCFTVLVDASASMATRDLGDRTRFEAALDRLDGGRAGFLRRLDGRAQLRAAVFDDSLRVVPFERLAAEAAPAGESTDLGQALVSAAGAAGTRHAGMLLISDGRHNAGADALQAARMLKTRGIPVWAACVGTTNDAADVAVSARLSQNFLFSGQPAALTARVSHSRFAYRRATVNLFREDAYVASRQVTLDKGVTAVEFPIEEARKGLFQYRVTVDPMPGEADTRNNARTVFVRVVDEKTRVLLVDARPHWDSKFLARVLQNDPNLNATSIFYLSPDKVFAVSETVSSETLGREIVESPIEMPRTRDALFAYDCLVFGRDMDKLLTPDEMNLVKDYLKERGGSVVFFRGKSYGGESPLAGVEPVAWAEEVLGNARLELTPEGRISPVFDLGHVQSADLIVRALPSLTSVTRVRREKSLSVVLAVGGAAGDKPVAALAYQRYGKGKVMTIGAAGLWRWAMLPPAMSEYGDVYERFWRQVIQWLVFESDFLPGQDIAFRTSAYTYRPGSRVAFSVDTKHVDTRFYAPRLDVTQPDGSRVTLPVSPRAEDEAAFMASFAPREEGEYRAMLRNNIGVPTECEARFTVYADLVEQRLVATDEDQLARIAAATGGELLDLAALDKLPDRVEEFARASRESARLDDAWAVLAAFVCLMTPLAAEWYLRRRWGLA